LVLACGDSEVGGDTGTGDPDGGPGTEDTGSSNPDTGTGGPDLGVLDLGEATARCTEPVEPSCVDQQISELLLFNNVSTGEISLEGGGNGVFENHINATGGGLTPTQSFVYAKFTPAGLEKVAISDEAAFESMDWDIAFRRYVIRTNSGVSGPSCTGVARVPGLATFDNVTMVTENLEFRTEAYMSDGTCELIPDGSGLPGSPAAALGSYWTYVSCVQMTGNIFVLNLASGRSIKLEILSYYEPGPQATCNETGSVPMPSGAGNVRIRWAFIE
jgi:hypothetical protein